MKKIRDGYKITEIGEIPEEWYISKLSELAQIKRGASPRPINNPKWFSEKKNVGWIRISDVTKTKKYLNSTEQYLSDEGVAKSRLVKPNDLIMSICATVGKPIILNIDACIHDGFILFDDLNNSKIITDYLYYLLQKKEEEFKGMGQTGTQATLNTNIVGSTLIAIPTIKEQKKIASILSTVDEQIDNIDALIEKNKELKKGLMQTLLTKGIGHTKFKTTEIGEIPEEWNIFKLSDCATIIDSLHETPEYSESGFPMIRVVDVNGKAINTKLTNKVCETIYKKFTKKYEPKQGDIIMSRVGSYGLVSYLKDSERVCLGQNIVIITTELCKKYLFYVLSSEYVKNNIEKVTVGSSQKTLSLANINELKILIPSIKEQNKISLILSDIDEKIEKYENKKQKLEELKKGLMQQLLSGQIRVNID